MAFETPLAMLKTLLLQLLTQRIGDLEAFQIIMDAYIESRTLDSAHQQEERFWDALGAVLDSGYDEDIETLAIVIDLDEAGARKSHEKQIVSRLQKIAQHTPGVRVILFSSPVDLEHATSTTTVSSKSPTTTLPLLTHSNASSSVSIENVSDDVQTIFRHGLKRFIYFADGDETDQEMILDQLMTVSGDSMLYAFLAVRFLKLQKSHDGFNQAVNVLDKSPHTVADIVQKLVATIHLDNQARTLLSLLVNSERPLSRSEVELLLRAQPQQSHLSENKIQLDHIIRSVAPFAMTGEGLITLRHRAIKDALRSLADSPQLSLPKDGHRDLLLRLFICIKNSFQPRDDQEPTLTPIEQNTIETRLASDRILEYTTRYWTVHFGKATSLHKPNDELDLPKELLSIFPRNVGFVLLESGCWRRQVFPNEAIKLLTVAYRVRRAVFGGEHPSVLQSAITCANFYEQTLCRPMEAVEWYVTASKIGRHVLGVQADLVITCCTSILRLSEALVSSTRTQITTCREEALILLISAYKHRYGETSEEVIEIYHKLVKHYVSIDEESKAMEISIKIKEITTVSHDEYKRPSGGARHLRVSLKKNNRPVVDSYDGLIFGYDEEDREEDWTITRVDELMTLVVEIIVEKHYVRAEEMLLELWLKLDEHCRGSQAADWHERKIQVTLKYVEVLHVQKRKEEEAALLLSCWNEYSSHTVSTFESIIIRLRDVAVYMKRVDMSSTALTVFKKCWSWYKSSHKEHTTIFQQIEENIAVTSKEIVKTASSTSTTAVTESSERVMREVFDSSFSSTQVTETETTAASSTTIALCESLTSIYMKEEKWVQATSILKQTLMKSSFCSFFSESIESIDLKDTMISKHISLVGKLADCYVHQKRYEKAESIYLRLCRVHRKSCARLDDALVIKYTDIYVDFLKSHSMFNQLISFYQELLVEFRSFYGHSHAETIGILYFLGDVCRTHSVTHGYYVDYYKEIVTALNQGALVCHENALRALLVVADHYYQSQRFSESLVYFRSITATFCKFGAKFKYFEDVKVVQQVLEKYCEAIEETKLETSEHLKVLEEIRQACVQYYGEDSSIAIAVTLNLAAVCQQSEAHQYQAVSYYEKVLKHSKTVSKVVIERSQSTLRSLYCKQVTSATNSKTVSKETIEKATSMTYSRYLEARKTHSITSQSTLTQLKELVTLYNRQSITEVAVTEMRSLVVDCLAKVTSSQELLDTAKYVASIYISCGESYVSHAMTLIHELKLQLIYKSASQQCGFDVTNVSVHNCFAFIAAFEWSFRSDLSLTISTFMAELLVESMYYERFSASFKSKAQMHTILAHAARLRSMLFRLHRNKDFEIVETKAVNYFMSVEPTVAKACSKNAIRSFLTVLLRHLSSNREIRLTQHTMTRRAGRAAVTELRSLLKQQKYKEAVELARCTYLFLMAHEGLDDPTEISLGFQLSLLMSGRNPQPKEEALPANDDNKSALKMPNDAALQKEMTELSRNILYEVLEITKTNGISLVRCQWSEINDLISLLGQLKDFDRLRWLLNTLWQSRESQATWGHNIMLALGTRLVQAQFITNTSSPPEQKSAVRLAEGLAYNVRRVDGARHQRTLDILALLASLYTATAQQYQSLAEAETNGTTADKKKRAGDMARLYFKKAAAVHEDVLKLLLDGNDGGNDDAGSEAESVVSSVGTAGTLRRSLLVRKGSNSLYVSQEHTHQHKSSISREQEVAAVAMHARLLKLAVQRLGGMAEHYQGLTGRAWKEYGDELAGHGVKEDEFRKWKMEGFGGGKCESVSGDGSFVEPRAWGIAIW